MVQKASLYTYNKVRHWLLKTRSGLYINCIILNLVVYITYTVQSVMVWGASLYNYNIVIYRLLKLCYVYILSILQYAVHEVSVMDGWCAWS